MLSVRTWRSGRALALWHPGCFGRTRLRVPRLSSRRWLDGRGRADRTRDRHQSRTAATGKRRPAALRPRGLGEGGRDFGHKARHLVLDLRVRLQADIEIEDDLVETGGLHLFQSVG